MAIKVRMGATLGASLLLLVGCTEAGLSEQAFFSDIDAFGVLDVGLQEGHRNAAPPSREPALDRTVTSSAGSSQAEDSGDAGKEDPEVFLNLITERPENDLGGSSDELAGGAGGDVQDAPFDEAPDATLDEANPSSEDDLGAPADEGAGEEAQVGEDPVDLNVIAAEP